MQQAFKEKNIAEFLYITNNRLPVERAHGIQIMSMCAELKKICAEKKIDFALIIPNRKNALGTDAFTYYGFEKTFTIIRLWCIDTIFSAIWLGRLAYWIQASTFMLSLIIYCICHRKTQRIIYSRELFVAALFRNAIWEAHTLPARPSRIFRLLLRRVGMIVAITHGLKQDLISLGVAPNDILVAHDGIDLKKFDLATNKKVARLSLNIPPEDVVAVYTGSFFQHSWKGVDILLEAAKILAHDHIRIILIGGHPEELILMDEYKAFPHITLVGHSNTDMVRMYLAAADMAILPNKSGSRISEHHTSPLKLFEYMAAQRLIIASRLPSICEIVDDSSAILIEPNNPTALVNAIRSAAEHPELYLNRVAAAFERVKKYSWAERSETIMTEILRCKTLNS